MPVDSCDIPSAGTPLSSPTFCDTVVVTVAAGDDDDDAVWPV